MGNNIFKDSFNKMAKAVGYKKEEARVLILGLDSAGKTTILYRMKLGEVVTTIPTIGFNVETLTFNNIQLTVWDVGGRDKIRPLYRHYFANTQAFIYVVDSNDRDRMPEALEEMTRSLNEDELRDCPVIILANKQDLPNAMSCSEIEDKLVAANSPVLKRKYKIFPVVATAGEGLQDAFEWMTNALLNKDVETNTQALMKPINETIKDIQAVSMGAEKNSFVSLIKNLVMFNFKTA